MGLVERLNELESMRQSGQISDSEYAMLVASATKKFSEEVEPAKASTKEAVSEIGLTHTQSKNLVAKPKLIGVGVVAVLLIGFLMYGSEVSKDKPSDSAGAASKILTTGTVSNDVKYRKKRLEMRLESFQGGRKRIGLDKFKINIGLKEFQIRGPVASLGGATDLLVISVTETYGAYPELAGEGGKVQKVLRELRDIYYAAYRKPSIPEIFSELDRVEPLWPTVVEASFQWEKALQKLIDESP